MFPFIAAKVLALKAMVLLLLALLIKIRITAFSALGFLQSLLQASALATLQRQGS